MRIGIITAFGKESKPLRSRMRELHREVIGDLVVFIHRYESDEITVIKTGQGRERGARGTHCLIERFAPHYIINCGVAGAISPHSRVGDIVISKNIVEYGSAEAGWSEQRVYYADPVLLRTAIQVSTVHLPEDTVHEGSILSGTDVINSRNTRASLWVRFGGICVEQEGAGVAKVSHDHKIPWIAIRGISDHADEHVLQDFKKNVDLASLHSALVTFETIKALANRSSVDR